MKLDKPPDEPNDFLQDPHTRRLNSESDVTPDPDTQQSENDDRPEYDPESTIVETDDAEQTTVEKIDPEQTIVQTVDPERTIVEDVDPEQTIVEAELSKVLEMFVETLAPEHQNLSQSHPQTSLRSKTSQTNIGAKSVSVRQRGIQAETNASASGKSDGQSDQTDGMDYLTKQLLGEGGMGTVHLARQVALGRDVALKQIKRRHRRTPSVRDDFLTEAVLTGKLEHPNIVPIYEVGSSADGDVFYSMKNIKGQAWHDSIDNLSLDENLDTLIDVCDAIAFAHAEGVVHRDLKPQNIMTGGFGEVLVLDWGLAVLTGPDGDVRASSAGTPAFMAPEMVNPPLIVGPRSDIYLLGGILFRILTGKPPHGGKTARQCLAAAAKNEIETADEDRVRKLDSSGELLGVALRAMATQPEDRFQTVPEFQQAIRNYVSHRESLELSNRAQTSLESAKSSNEYPQFSRAMFGFEEALKLWDQNTQATEGAAEARLAWALCAEVQSDFDLSLSLLDDSTVEQQEIRVRVTVARDERNARQNQVRRLRRISLVTSLSVAVVACIAAVWINTERNKAVAAKQLAREQRDIAVIQRKLARDAVDKMLTEVGQEQLEYVPKMQLVRHNLLTRALDFYKKFLKEQPDDPSVRAESAQVYFHVADISANLGRDQEAKMPTLSRSTCSNN